MPTSLFWRPERTGELQSWNWTPNRTLLRVQNKNPLHRGSPHVSCFEDHFPFPSLRQERLCQSFTRGASTLPVRKSSTPIIGMGLTQSQGDQQHIVTLHQYLSQSQYGGQEGRWGAWVLKRTILINVSPSVWDKPTPSSHSFPNCNVWKHTGAFMHMHVHTHTRNSKAKQ